MDVETGVFLGDPMDKLLDLFVLQEPGDGVVVLQQFPLGEDAVDLAVADPMQRHCLLTLEGLRDEMVLIVRAVDEFSGAQRAEHRMDNSRKNGTAGWI